MKILGKHGAMRSCKALLLSGLLSLLAAPAGAQRYNFSSPLTYHLSAERAEEVLSTPCGGVLESTGRVLNCGRLASNISEWAQSPAPTRAFDYHNFNFNSDKWDIAQLDKYDIVIATVAKSGTTWTQAIVGWLLIRKGIWPPLREVQRNRQQEFLSGRSPWVEQRLTPPSAMLRLWPMLASPRLLKTHLPLDGLEIRPDLSYIYVARDPRDVAYSWINHWCACTPHYLRVVNQDSFRKGPPFPVCNKTALDKRAFTMGVIEDTDAGGNFLWSYWNHVATWWAYRHLPNILFVHFTQLKENPDREYTRIANFLGIDVDAEDIAYLREETNLEKMRKGKFMNPVASSTLFAKGNADFLYKGVNGRWKDDLTESDNKRVTQVGKERLGEECWHWIETGELPANDGKKDEL